MNMAVIPDNSNMANERFGFTLFVSIALHVVLILGVGFGILEQASSSTSLEITLAHYRSQDAPQEADFLAQENQQGSGSLEDKAAPSTPVESRFSDDRIQDVSPFMESNDIEQQRQEQVITSTADALQVKDEKVIEETPEVADQPLENLTDAEFNQRLSSLQAQLAIRRQEYAKRPRRYTISSASTQKARDAIYLDNWRKKVEAVGNLNYPTEASTQGIYGNLRLLVSLRADGSVANIRALSSSGHKVLDDAAIRIVQLAAPFSPFPPKMRADVDVLEIIRTWQFQRGNTFTSF